MWQQLSEMALAHGDLRIAERCAAALGDVSCLRYLHRVNKIAAKEEGGANHWDVRSRMALLRKNVSDAETVLLQQGKTREAIEMHRMLRNYDEAISVAESRGDPEAASMRQGYYQYLLDTRQEELAARLKEEEGDHIQAINLYLKGGLPGLAANVIKRHNINNPPSMLEGVATALTGAGLHDRAGEFYEKMDQLQRALDAYIKGHAYRKAVDLARRAFPGQVVALQEMWGDHLVACKQVDMAINHYTEASAYPKAIEAALGSRQWVKAAQMVENLATDTAKPFFRRLARHYEEAQQYEEAEKYWVQAEATQLAVEMYTKANQWERAHKLASSYMTEREVGMLYIAQAQKLEAQGKLKDAERLYLTINEADLAINMYKKARKYDAMVRLVATHRKELLKETHQFLAQHLETEGNLRDAEHHYCEAGEWLSAVNMYRSNDMWEEAIRVAKLCGGPNASKRVAYAWALALGGDQGAKLLTKLGLIEPAIDYAIESGAFDHAFELARSSCASKLPEIHLKHALYLEDEERYKDAEAEFINASKPREAIDMYVHQQGWADAMRVADTYDPSAVPDVYAAQARAAADARDYAKAEELFLLGSKPELALAMYQEAAMWPEALALTQRHLPHKLSEVSVAYSQAQAQQGTGGSKADFLNAGRMWEQQKQWSQAIDAYLNATREVLPNPDDLVEVLDCAVTVARRNCLGATRRRPPRSRAGCARGATRRQPSYCARLTNLRRRSPVRWRGRRGPRRANSRRATARSRSASSRRTAARSRRRPTRTGCSSSGTRTPRSTCSPSARTGTGSGRWPRASGARPRWPPSTSRCRSTRSSCMPAVQATARRSRRPCTRSTRTARRPRRPAPRCTPSSSRRCSRARRSRRASSSTRRP